MPSTVILPYPSSGHIQSMAAAGEEVRAEVDKFKNAFTLMAHKVR